MTNKLETIEASSSVQEAAKKMRDKSISSLVVVDSSNKSIGIITERDLVRKVCASDSSSKNKRQVYLKSLWVRFDNQALILAGTWVIGVNTDLLQMMFFHDYSDTW